MPKSKGGDVSGPNDSDAPVPYNESQGNIDRTADQSTHHRQAFGSWLKAKRQALGITQQEAARRAGMNMGQQWSNYERGKSPNRVTVLAMAEALSADSEEALRVAGFSATSLAEDLLESSRRRSSIQLLPFELQLARARWADRRAEFRDKEEDKEITVINVPYTNIHEIATMQEELQKAVEERLGLKVERMEVETEWFDAIHNPELAYFKTLYTFPFFLSQIRRGDWAVIPYGHQRSIGIIIHPEHKAFAQLKSLDPTRRPGTPAPIPGEPSDWLIPLCQPFSKRTLSKESLSERSPSSQPPSEGADGGYVYAVRGYVHQDIILHLMFGTPEFRSLRSIYKRHFRPIHPSRIPQTEAEMAKPDNYSRHIMLVDLGDRVDKNGNLELECHAHRRPILDDNLNHKLKHKTFGATGHQLLVIPHFMDIPVGIGFSLSMLPTLLQQERWRELVKVAIDALSPAKHALAGAGIEFDPRMSEVSQGINEPSLISPR